MTAPPPRRRPPRLSPTGVRAPRVRARHGFTLIEVLVVIGIIATLISILGVSIGALLGSSQERATQATVLKLHGMLQNRLEALDRVLEPNRVNIYRTEHAQLKRRLMSGFGGGFTDDVADRLARMLIRKRAEKALFPQRDSEFPSITFESSPGDRTVSSELLYHALVNGLEAGANVTGDTTSINSTAKFGLPAVGVDAFKDSEVGDTDGDGHPEFLDGWGRPLRFYRWPTRLIRPEGAGLVATGEALNIRKTLVPHLPDDMLHQDPDDPFLLTNFIYTPIENMETQLHTSGTWHGFLIVSAGGDGILGLEEPYNNATGKFGHLARPTDDEIAEPDAIFDNITNRQRSTDAR